MNRLVISEETNPYYNLALEEELLKTVRNNETILYLWQNDKTVVIGRNQNPYLECNIDYMNENNIFLARRISGGGAVFHDLANLNFTFVTKEENVNLEKQMKVLKLVVEGFGLKVEFSGRNDLLVNGRKFSGHAFYNEDGNYFHHGTLMVNVNVNILGDVLNPSKLKLKSKGIKSVKSRVINLNELNNEITIESLKNSLEKAFEKIYGKISEKDIYNVNLKIPKFYDKYKNPLWNFGESPKYDVILEEKLPIGNIQVNLNIENGIVKEGRIHSDTLKNIDFKNIEEKLIGKIFLKDNILNIIREDLM
ncbi:lipoate-protein ligase A [Clostridium moniliforme]|uniref:lipoate--protein ligase n=1 Tax=Clostridium moniliforme TaxID=39489 RepID=A0ABS4EXH3_9CLOT|nr:lipoate--protein ligase [Clostridium moniliforme]MBP1888695.1 lipoate-protein ligase A [Clostridium moniliforme]